MVIDNKKFLGSRIREIRKNRSLTQEQLAERVGIEQRHISRIEGGYDPPSFGTLEKIAYHLNVSIKDLFSFEHLNSREILTQNLHKIVKETSTENLVLFYKLIEAINK